MSESPRLVVAGRADGLRQYLVRPLFARLIIDGLVERREDAAPDLVPLGSVLPAAQRGRIVLDLLQSAPSTSSKSRRTGREPHLAGFAGLFALTMASQFS